MVLRAITLLQALSCRHNRIHDDGHRHGVSNSTYMGAGTAMKILSYFFIGIVFGLGLILSGMTLPLKVLGFLHIFGNWDPTLAFVMGTAVITTTVGYRLILRRNSPVLDNSFFLPSVRIIDTKLLLGACLFGMGWGWLGFVLDLLLQL